MSDDDPTATEEFAGSRLEIQENGDYSIDTRDASQGDVHVHLSDGRALVVHVDGSPALSVSRSGGTTTIDLGGSASERVLLGDAFKAFLNEFLATKFDLHVHPTSMGPSGPPLPPFTGTMMGDDLLSNVTRTNRD
jgi:hypothetical protein